MVPLKLLLNLIRIIHLFDNKSTILYEKLMFDDRSMVDLVILRRLTPKKYICFLQIFCYDMLMRWHQMTELPTIEAPEGCEGEAQIVVSRPESHHLTAGVVFSCPGIASSTLNVVFKETTKIGPDSEEGAFINQMAPIGEMAVRQFCKNCPLRPNAPDTGESQAQLEAHGSPD
jgi:hypothetical protein